MATKYNFAQLTNASKFRLTKKKKITYRTISTAGTETLTLGTDLGNVTKSFGAQTLNCFETVCSFTARDTSTLANTVDVAYAIQYSTLDVKKGALVIQYGTSVDLPTASVRIRLYVTGSPTNYNEYVIDALKYVDSNTTYSSVIKLTNTDGTAILPTSVGGTGLGSSGTPEVEVIVNDPGVAAYTLSLFDILYIPDPSELECEDKFEWSCIDTSTYNSTLTTIVKRCFASEYSTEAVEEELEVVLQGLNRHFWLIDPRAVYSKTKTLGVTETVTTTLSAKTVNGINYASYQLPTTFAQGCDISGVELPSCGDLVDATKLCLNNASQALLTDQYMIYEESNNNSALYYILVNSSHVGESATVTYVVNGSNSVVQFDDERINDVYYDAEQDFQIIGTDGKKVSITIKLANVKPTTFPTLNLSGTAEVTNTVNFKFKRKDVTLIGV